MLDSNKKLSILYILEVLKEYSDEEHLLTQQNIIDKIYSLYGMQLERKSISASIQSLIDLGYDINSLPHKGYYLGERVIEPSELSFIIDALFSSKSLTGKQAQDLTKKLSSTLSIYNRKKYNYIYKADAISRSINKSLFYNIDIIQEAIEKNKMLELVYERPYFEKKIGYTKPQKINPYFMYNNQGRYYLVCNINYWDDLTNLKIDQIKDIKILDEPIKQIEKVKGHEDALDISKYVNEHIYSFGGKSINATLLLDTEYSVTPLEDWFKGHYKIYKQDDKMYAKIKVNEQALIFWCLQYGEGIELIEPQETREKIKEKSQKITNRYSK